ncbi:aldehyde dehydrogenase [Obba rivulosa]|uniref:Aldehyde dehydrogenase n=1 Tax=Obba rivulosa TaxID=1052685 RepID=A0A8E2DVI1_9APHY|nr:aldehyde dehydrogenase [Obba rivulosa]
MTVVQLQFTALDEISKVHERLRKTFESGITRPLQYRRTQLLQIAHFIQDNWKAIEDAIISDYGRSRSEMSELKTVFDHAIHAAQDLEEWSKPEKPKVEDWLAGWDPTIYPTPKGTVLIISPWNAPYFTTFSPLIGAMAAGCTALIKPSELCPATSQLLADLFPKYFDSNAYAVVNGAVAEATRLLELKWDHILYTGAPKVARIVAAAAAKHLTPLTLELGGKCPVLIDDDVDIDLVAKRVLYGKQFIAGQACISPDYVLVPPGKMETLIAAFKKYYSTFWPKGPLNEGYSRIIAPHHHARLKNMLEHTKGDIVLGGEIEGSERIAPTIVKNVPLDDILMEEEIFGPILPLIQVSGMEEALNIVKELSSPLAIYVFTNSEKLKETLLNSTASGALCFNDTLSHAGVRELPFGGIGESGYGCHGGKYSFDTFTHRRSYANVPPAGEPFMAMRYPPCKDEVYQALTAPTRAEIPKPW